MVCELSTDELAELAIAEILERFTKKYGEPIGAGLDRIVFDAGDWVVKVPRSPWHYGANYKEASYGSKACNSEIFAVCRLFHINEVPVLWMEKVQPARYSEDMPEWVNFIDCQQVGYNRKGRLVAYDYG